MAAETRALTLFAYHIYMCEINLLWVLHKHIGQKLQQALLAIALLKAMNKKQWVHGGLFCLVSELNYKDYLFNNLQFQKN